MTNKDYKQIKKYLLKEQGWEKEVVEKMSKEELEEMWEYFHED